MPRQIVTRNGLASEWTAANPVLLEGEVGLETDTNKRKTGNGTDTWNTLPYENIYTDAEKAKVANTPTDTITELDGKKDAFEHNSAFNKSFGTTGDTVTEGNDPRLFDARTPTSHGHTKHTERYEEIEVAAMERAAHEAAIPDHVNHLTDAEQLKVGNIPDDTVTELSNKQDILDEGPFANGDKTDLDNLVLGNETGAFEMTAEEVKTAIESNPDTNNYTDAEKAKIGNLPTDTIDELSSKQNILDEGPFVDGDKTDLDALMTDVMTDVSNATIKTAYENNADTNEYTDTEKDKVFRLRNNTIVSLSYKEDVFTKNGAFNKDFGTVAGTVTAGNDTRLVGGGIHPSEKGVADGVAPLGADTKIALGYIPDRVFVSVHEVADETEQLGLTAEQGDIACRTDEDVAYVHNGGTSDDMTDWTVFLMPDGAVLSVLGFTGTVTKADLLAALNVEDGAAGDMTTGEIQTAYANNPDTNLYTKAEGGKMGRAPFDMGAALDAKQDILAEGPFEDEDKANLDILAETAALGISDEEVEASYEVNVDTNKYTTADQLKVYNLPLDTNAELATKQDVLTEGAFVDGDKTKLDDIPEDVSGELSGKQDVLAEGAFIDGDKTHLDDLVSLTESGMSDEDVKIAYENNADTNAYTDSEKDKVANVPSDLGSTLSDKQDVLTEGAFVDGDKTKLDTVGGDISGDLSSKQDVLAEGPFVDGDKTALDDLASGGDGTGGEEASYPAPPILSQYANTVNFAMKMEKIFEPPASEYEEVFVNEYTDGPAHGESYTWGAFSGAALAQDGRVILAPYGASNIGIFDPSDDSYSNVACPDAGSLSFQGAVTITDGRVIFAPYQSGNIGIFDPSDNSYTTGPSANGFTGAALAQDGRVIFSPYNSDDIGIFDPSDNSYSTVACSDGGSRSFWGAVTINDGRVIFVPATCGSVGIFDPSDDSYTSGPSHGEYDDWGVFAGVALAPDGRVIFAPKASSNIGIFDPSDDSYTGVSHGGASYHGAALAPDGRVIFAPGDSSNIGIFDPSDDSYTTVSGSGTFRGAAPTQDGRVIFAPYNYSNIGIFSSYTENQIVRTDGTYSSVSGPTGSYKFVGAALTQDNRIIFAPNAYGYVGIFDPSTDSYSDGPPHNEGSWAFHGAVTVPDGRAVLVPRMSGNIGIFDPSDDSYTAVEYVDSSTGTSGGTCFGGTLVPDGRIVFCPGEYNDYIGIFDPSDNSYTQGPAHGQGGRYKFRGSALTQDGRVVLVPLEASRIIIYTPSNNTCTTGPSASGFIGATLVPDGRVIMAPYDSGNIGIFDPSDNSYTPGPSANGFRSAALTPNGRVILAPYGASNIGIFDPSDDSYTTCSGSSGFSGAALTSDGRVIFAPYGASNIGIFDTGLYLRGGIMTATHKCVSTSI